MNNYKPIIIRMTPVILIIIVWVMEKVSVRDRKYVGAPSLGRLAVQGLAGVIVNKTSVEL